MFIYKRMRMIAIYACMVVSFLQLASCSAHHRMYGNKGKNASIDIEMSGQKKGDKRRGKRVLHSKCRSIAPEQLNSQNVKVIRRWHNAGSMLNIVLLASLGYVGFQYWSNNALGTTDVMEKINASLALIYNRLTPIEKNVSNVWTYLSENATGHYNNILAWDRKLFEIEEAYRAICGPPISDRFECCIGPYSEQS